MFMQQEHHVTYGKLQIWIQTPKTKTLILT
jgi:hypothetical protein